MVIDDHRVNSVDDANLKIAGIFYFKIIIILFSRPLSMHFGANAGSTDDWN